FGADLGAEKFFNIKCRIGNLQPRAAVLVATVKAVKYQGTSGKAAGEQGEKGRAALRDGFRNLARHIRNVRRFGVPVVVAVNRFPSDEPEDLAQLEALCRELGVEAVPVEVWESGGEGGIALARAVLDVLEGDASEFRFLYDDRSSLAEKIAVIAREMYGAAEVGFTGPARRTLLELEARDLGTLPVCIAKTQYSFSGDPALKGCPEGFELKIREVRLAAGAGFIVALAGEVHTMPGLPEQPAAERVELGGNGEISGLF
ncbi:MAG: formate--tetrahydrofolate ligase, partial [Firmicutes bacterium]|nr:formate--tetrahydrofolate ligase [Bacillota bacterium]